MTSLTSLQAKVDIAKYITLIIITHRATYHYHIGHESHLQNSLSQCA